MLTESAKAFGIFILSCISICKILKFFQIRDYFLNCTTMEY